MRNERKSTMLMTMAIRTRPLRLYSVYSRSSKASIGLGMGAPRSRDDDVSLGRRPVGGNDPFDLPPRGLQQPFEFLEVEEVEGPGLLEVDELLGLVEEDAQGF